MPTPRRKPEVSNYDFLCALLYIIENGCKWRALPNEYGNWHTIYVRFNRWCKSGVIDRIFETLQEENMIEITIPIERNTIAVLIVMTRTHDTAIVPNMIIVSHFLEYVKDGIHYITGTETVLCPDCGQIMNPHCRCRRYIRRLNGMRDKLSVRVLFCALCHRYHRELPDFVTPFKHLCTEAIAAIHDAVGDYCVDDHSAARIRRWVERLLKFGSATVRRLKLEYPMLVTNYDVNSTFDTLRYFVRAVANADEWKANEFV